MEFAAGRVRPGDDGAGERGDLFGVPPIACRAISRRWRPSASTRRAVPIFETQSDAATIHPALEEIFAAPSPPTAILAESDRIAFIAIDWLKARGLSVPGDVSIVGFDGVPESATSSPPLTTVQQPIAEIGRRAVRAILDHGGEVWRETLDVQLVVRGSTSPPRG